MKDTCGLCGGWTDRAMKVPALGLPDCSCGMGKWRGDGLVNSSASATMNIPPFPFVPASQEQRIQLEQWGKQIRVIALGMAAQIADAERAEFMPQAANNNGSRESDFAFGSVNSSDRIATAIRAEIERD